MFVCAILFVQKTLFLNEGSLSYGSKFLRETPHSRCRQASEKIFRAFIAYSEFTSQANSQYLDTLNQMTATINGVSKTFEIISSELKGVGSLCKHFDVLMKVVE